VLLRQGRRVGGGDKGVQTSRKRKQTSARATAAAGEEWRGEVIEESFLPSAYLEEERARGGTKERRLVLLSPRPRPRLPIIGQIFGQKRGGRVAHTEAVVRKRVVSANEANMVNMVSLVSSALSDAQ